MNTSMALKNEEKVVFALRELYQKYGYSQFKMSKFEEYDFYAGNKDFLISENIITFTDTNGKLMALKPDVTLSIVKNSKDMPNMVQKVHYDENVYRVSKGNRAFKEIMQVGLECIGDVDDYCISEVLLLAAKSLGTISREYVLDISHLGIVLNVINRLGISKKQYQSVLKCIGEKNFHELSSICSQAGASEQDTAALRELVSAHGAPQTVLPHLREVLGDCPELEQLDSVVSALESSVGNAVINIDFSIISNIHYYNGIVFKGFVKGVPESVLSGGQYDSLMKKMGRKSGAIGFAVYVDLLEQLDRAERKYDVDTVLLYDAATPLSRIGEAVRTLTEQGLSVTAQRSVPEKMAYRQLIKLDESGVNFVE